MPVVPLVWTEDVVDDADDAGGELVPVGELVPDAESVEEATL
jgi:hypothetical protein